MVREKKLKFLYLVHLDETSLVSIVSLDYISSSFGSSDIQISRNWTYIGEFGFLHYWYSLDLDPFGESDLVVCLVRVYRSMLDVITQLSFLSIR